MAAINLLQRTQPFLFLSSCWNSYLVKPLFMFFRPTDTPSSPFITYAYIEKPGTIHLPLSLVFLF